MPRLIDKRCAIKHLKELLKHSIMPTEWYEGAKSAITLLQKEPTVESVRHGHWIKSEDADDGYCSFCKCDMPMYREDWEWKYFETPYCPFCGAKMDEVEDG